MPLSDEQIAALVRMVASAESDDLDCGGCYEQLSEFADAQLAGKEIAEALKAVEIHLQQCQCCHDEFTALMESLREIDTP